MANGSSVSTSQGKSRTIRTTFSRETSVSIDIRAGADTLWSLLTDATNYPNWNSTVISIEGEIQPNKKIKLKSSLDPKRIFTLSVKEFESEKKLVWGDGQGSRTFTLEPVEGGKICFSMTEKIGGLMFPLYAKYIPPFDEIFEKFVADLKKEAESINQK